MPDLTLPPLNGIARKTRVDKGIARKSAMDTFADLFRRMTASEQATAMEVLRQIQRIGATQEELKRGDDDGR
jgi:hypothetical protein